MIQPLNTPVYLDLEDISCSTIVPLASKTTDLDLGFDLENAALEPIPGRLFLYWRTLCSRR